MKIDFDAEDLRPLVKLIVEEVLAQQAGADAKVNGRLGYTEAQAAGLLGIPKHRLRDCRLREEIQARKIGKAYIYPAESLRRFLQEQQT